MVSVSTDDGKTWTEIARADDLRWASMFIVKDQVYLMGNSIKTGAAKIARLKADNTFESADIVKGVGGETKETIAEILASHEKYEYLTEEDLAAMQEYLDKQMKGGHACFSETARCTYFRPETMRLDGIADESGDNTHRFDAFNEYGIKTHFAWMGNYPNSYSASNGYKMNERIAKAFTEHRIPKMAAAFRFLKEETISNEYFAEWRPKQK